MRVSISLCHVCMRSPMYLNLFLRVHVFRSLSKIHLSTQYLQGTRYALSINRRYLKYDFCIFVFIIYETLLSIIFKIVLTVLFYLRVHKFDNNLLISHYYLQSTIPLHLEKQLPFLVNQQLFVSTKHFQFPYHSRQFLFVASMSPFDL